MATPSIPGVTGPTTTTQHLPDQPAAPYIRSIHAIAKDIVGHWPNPCFSAKPYIKAMLWLTFIADSYGQDSAKDIVLRFLSNASTWRGENARRIKDELKALL